MRFALLIAAFACFAAPLHAEVRYTLDCQAGRVGTVTTKGVEGAGTYGYLVISVTNNNGREVPLSLGAWADTDVAGRKYRGGNDPIVKAMVERVTGKSYKTLEEARGKIADKATVDILISFGKLDPNVDTLTVNVTGLVDRVFRDHGKTWVEDKALVFTLSRPGDEFERQNDVVKVTGKRWKVLAEAKELRKI
jgi:hypothetical protein